MKSVLISCMIAFLASFCVSIANAQFSGAAIGVNGLTCSQCTRSVEMALRRLDFVADVHMNLEHTKGAITFKKNKTVDFRKVAQAVVDAGFSVRYIIADYNYPNESALSSCIKDKKTLYYPINSAVPQSSMVKLLLCAKGMISKEEMKQYEISNFSASSSCDSTAKVKVPFFLLR